MDTCGQEAEESMHNVSFNLRYLDVGKISSPFNLQNLKVRVKFTDVNVKDKLRVVCLNLSVLKVMITMWPTNKRGL